MDEKKKQELIINHVFNDGDPVLVGGDREIPGVVADSSQEQLKVRLNSTGRFLYTTRFKEFTKPDISKIYSEDVSYRNSEETDSLPFDMEETMVMKMDEENQLEQLLLF